MHGRLPDALHTCLSQRRGSTSKCGMADCWIGVGVLKLIAASEQTQPTSGLGMPQYMGWVCEVAQSCPRHATCLVPDQHTFQMVC